MPSDPRDHAAALRRFFLISYLVVLANTAGFLGLARWQSGLASAYLVVVFLTYGAFYLAPVFVPLLLLRRFTRKSAGGSPSRGRVVGTWVYLILGTTAVQLLLYADAVVFRMFGFHFNGFVWNLMVTEGGMESMGAGASTERTFALIAAGFLVLQVVAAWVATRSWWRRSDVSVARRKPVMLVVTLVLALTVSERLTFALSEQANYLPVITEGNRFPFYMEFHWRGLGRWLGLGAGDDRIVVGLPGQGNLQYPLAPLPPLPETPRYNIVWLVAESLRADALDPEIMPETWAFASDSTRFVEHRSGGNGTRMGMFSMFYGLTGNNWFPMLRARRGPVLMDEIIAADYQLALYTSARFTYPEFDKTVFAAVPTDVMTERQKGLMGWEDDRLHVGSLLESLDERDVTRPFFTFMFFESSHAPYDFPEESVIRRPYLEDFDYATMDPETDMPLVWARYVNSCHHLDGQLGRVFDGLRERGLLDSTIVVVTGDHGEEFMEQGRWGHNSEFTEQQIRVPLVLHIPGREPTVVTRRSSHLDLPATVLTALGVQAPAEDYSLGHDLFGTEERVDWVVADWDRLGLMSDTGKIAVSMKQGDFSAPRVATPDDVLLEGEAAASVLGLGRARLVQVFKESARFVR